VKLPILGNIGIKEILILGASAFVVHHVIKMHAASSVVHGDAKIPAAVPIANTPTSPVPPFRESQRLSAFNARTSNSLGNNACGCSGL
jgi:hypothetical protein